MLDLSPDELLTTTRSVRRRLDLERPLPRRLIEECLEVALQAPTGGNRQDWGFLVVTEPERRAALAEIYRRSWTRYLAEGVLGEPPKRSADPAKRGLQKRIGRSAAYLTEHLHEVPALLVPVHRGRVEGKPSLVQASAYGSVLPAVWSFMLAARARGLGTAWTTIHLFHEEEAAEVLGIPYAEYTQVAMIPVAYAKGTDFKPGPREPLDAVVRWERWSG